MLETLITNMVSNFFICIWMYLLVTDHRHRKPVTAVIGILTTLLYQGIAFAAMKFNILGTLGVFAVFWSAVLIYGASYVFLMQKGKISTSLFIVLTYYSLWTFMYLTINIVTGAVYGDGDIVIWVLRIGMNVLFLAIYVIFLRKRLAENIDVINRSSWLLLSVSAFIFMMFVTFMSVSQFRTMSGFTQIFGFISCFFLFISVFYLIFRFLHQSKRQQELLQIAAQNRLLQETVQSYEQMERQIKQARHDERHHHLMLLELAKANDTESIIRYLNEYEDAETEKTPRHFCANKSVDIIMTAYSRKAEQAGISYSADIDIPETLSVSDVDLVSILANILENAINGCIKMGSSGTIGFSMKKKMQKLVIECSNPCSGVQIKDGLPENSGVGIMSIQATAEKYGGDLECSASDGVFRCCVIINDI